MLRCRKRLKPGVLRGMSLEARADRMPGRPFHQRLPKENDIVIRLATRLRIGEKMALGFGVLGLTFLGVIWHDRVVLDQVLADSTRLQTVYGARQAYAFDIERGLAAMRGAEQAFLARRELAQADALAREANRFEATTRALATLDASSAQTAEEIRSSADDYRRRFEAIVEAWRVKGLDHDSGLQGAFRTSAHELEALMLAHGLPALEVEVLQLRRREKDYLLRDDPVYVEMVDSIAANLAPRIAVEPLSPADRISSPRCSRPICAISTPWSIKTPGSSSSPSRWTPPPLGSRPWWPPTSRPPGTTWP